MSIIDELGLDPDNVRWEDLASCKNLPDAMINLFFDDYEEDEIFAREADQICLACPVIKQCLEDGMNNQQEYVVRYLPAESDSGLFGGNSNWRGPIWMPVNFAIIRALIVYFSYFGKEFQEEVPTGSGQMANLYEVAENLTHRLVSIFTRNPEGLRPVFGSQQTFQSDPNWNDYLLFYEYFHGDNGAGIGASHQTGWSGLVVNCIHWFAVNTQESRLAAGAQTGPFTVWPGVEN